MKFLAVDLGASSGRTIVGTIENGKISLAETHRFTNGMEDVDGSKHWDVMGLVEEIKKGIATAGEVQGIGVDTWGVDFGLIDAEGKLLGKPYAYRDSRNEAAMPNVYDKISKGELYARVGIQEMPFNSIFQVMADLVNRPETLDKAKRILFMPELITYLLTGEAAHEYTICSTTAMIDARSRDWDWDLIRLLGFPEKLFGPIKPSGSRCGSYNGTPVYLPPMHDTASAVVAVPATKPGEWAFLSSGTWSLIGAELNEPVLTEASAKADFTNEGGTDGKIRFLKNVNGLWLIQECRRIWEQQGKKLEFSEIAAAAEASDFDGTINPNAPRFMAPEDMPAEITAALQESGQPAPSDVGEYARCCYLSLAKAYGEQLRLMQEVTGKTFERLHVVGGGCQAKLLNQLTANELKIPVVAGPVEATALGNLCTQARAAGLFKDLNEVRACIAASFPVETYLPEE